MKTFILDHGVSEQEPWDLISMKKNVTKHCSTSVWTAHLHARTATEINVFKLSVASLAACITSHVLPPNAIAKWR